MKRLVARLTGLGLAFALAHAAGPPAGISAQSLRGNLSFLASDVLQGRNTPSHGLDVAAEFIAASFRRAGLEPGGGDGYFQTATLYRTTRNLAGFRLEFEQDGKRTEVGAEDVKVFGTDAVDLTRAPAIKPEAGEAEADFQGKALLVSAAEFPRWRRRLRSAGAAVLIGIGREEPIMSEGDYGLVSFEPPASGPASLLVLSPALADAFEKLTAGATVTMRLPQASAVETKARNVIGILRGSDPALKDTAVALSAHYDHVGTRTSGPDRIYNGANDDGSGVVSVLEIAAALAAMPERPRRSIIFVCFFGEEEGMLGSNYYARHPSFPIAKTVAQINLEQVGRTDDTEGPQPAKATLTGFDYSTVTQVFVNAGKQTGVTLARRERNPSEYFARSDNLPLAEAGVPAHTFVVALDYPDYHRPGDEWQKIDYDNMAKIVATVALGVEMIANDPEAPRWNADEPATERYRRSLQQPAPALSPGS